MTAATARPRTAMKRLAGALFFVCLVLFLLAIEQRHTVAAVEAVRDETGPALRRIAGRLGGMTSGPGRGFETLASSLPQIDVWRTAPAVRSSAGTEPPTDAPATPGQPTAGSLTLVGAELRFGNGDVVRTRPLRIAWGREAFSPGRSFAAQLNASIDAQIELREVVAPSAGGAAPALKLCNGDPARVAAVLRGRDTVQVMLFRSSTVGPQTAPSAVCGVWSFPTG